MGEKIDIGKFDDVVYIMTPIITHDSANARKVTYQRQAMVFACVDHVMNDEMVADRNENSEEIVTVTTWCIPDVTTKHAVEYNGEIYDILSVNYPHRTQYMKMDCIKHIDNA